jgi:anhydro-N-acetylmuramic acid kinase
MRVVGLMSGTSADAIDVAVCDFAQADAGVLSLRVMGFREEPFPPRLRDTLLALLRNGAASLEAITEINFALGEAFAGAVTSALGHLDLRPAGIDLIASHGQTIYHLAEPGRRRATLQMGEPAVIAVRTRITVAADYRVADVAAGGEGAPLVAFLDRLIFGRSGRTVALQNIGGIANVTFLSPDGSVLAFDTGPGNVLLDYGAAVFSGGGARYDRAGAMASAGSVDQALLEEVLAHPYFSRPPPKTTGRELFGDQFAEAVLGRARSRGLRPEDTMATLTAITAESVTRAYRDFGPKRVDEVVLSGGGSQNSALVGEIARRLEGVRLIRSDDLGLPSAAKEAIAFALLGHEAVHGRSADMGPCTGATRPVILGKIIPGDNFRALMRSVWEAKTWPAIHRVQLTAP